MLNECSRKPPVRQAAWAILTVAALSWNLLLALHSGDARSQPAQHPESISERTLSRLLLIAGTRAGNRLIAVGDQGYAIYSDDQAKSWKRGLTSNQGNPSRRAMLTAVTFVDDKRGWACGHDGQIIATQDGGATWIEQRYKPEDKQPLFALRFSDPEHGIAIGAYGLFLETVDAGKTWTPRAITQDDKHFYAIAGDDKGRLAIAAEAGTLLVSGDSGKTWETVASPYKGSFFGLVATADNALLAFGLRGNVFKSGDFGKTWTAAKTDSTTTLQGGARLADGELVLVGSAGTVISSRDNGATFRKLPAQKAVTWSTVLPTDTGALLLGESGVVRFSP